MSDQNLVLSDRDGVLVQHISFQENKQITIICSPVCDSLLKCQMNVVNTKVPIEDTTV